jgi:putative endonuclease
MFWVYLLENPQGRFYIGHTADLQTRLHSHNRTDKLAVKFTRKNGSWELVWTEEHETQN